MSDDGLQGTGYPDSGSEPDRTKPVEFQLGGRHLTIAVVGLTLFGSVLFLLGRWSDRAARSGAGAEAEESAPAAAAPGKDDAAPRELTFYETLGKQSGPGFQESRPPAVPKEPPAQLPARPPAAASPTPTSDSARAPATAEAKVAEGSDRYRVQVASTRDRTGAQELVNRLRRKGYPATLESVPGEEGKPRYKVRVGNYSEREAAERLASRIRIEEKVGAWIVKVQG